MAAWSVTATTEQGTPPTPRELGLPGSVAGVAPLQVPSGHFLELVTQSLSQGGAADRTPPVARGRREGGLAGRAPLAPGQERAELRTPPRSQDRPSLADERGTESAALRPTSRKRAPAVGTEVPGAARRQRIEQGPEEERTSRDKERSQVERGSEVAGAAVAVDPRSAKGATEFPSPDASPVDAPAVASAPAGSPAAETVPASDAGGAPAHWLSSWNVRSEQASAEVPGVTNGELANGDLLRGDLLGGNLLRGELVSGDLASGDLVSEVVVDGLPGGIALSWQGATDGVAGPVEHSEMLSSQELTVGVPAAVVAADLAAVTAMVSEDAVAAATEGETGVVQGVVPSLSEGMALDAVVSDESLSQKLPGTGEVAPLPLAELSAGLAVEESVTAGSSGEAGVLNGSVKDVTAGGSDSSRTGQRGDGSDATLLSGEAGRGMDGVAALGDSSLEQDSSQEQDEGSRAERHDSALPRDAGHLAAAAAGRREPGAGVGSSAANGAAGRGASVAAVTAMAASPFDRRGIPSPGAEAIGAGAIGAEALGAGASAVELAADAGGKGVGESSARLPEHIAGTLPQGLARDEMGDSGLRQLWQRPLGSRTIPAGPVVDRVMQALQSAQQTEQGLKLRLQPPELGALEVQVSVRDGSVTARLEAQTLTAQQIISENLSQLKEALQQQGMTVERIDVLLADGRHTQGQGEFSQGSAQQQLPFERDAGPGLAGRPGVPAGRVRAAVTASSQGAAPQPLRQLDVHV